MKDEYEVPRRNQLDKNTYAEMAIYNAMVEVEKLSWVGEEMTACITALSKAKDLLSDYVDLMEAMNDPQTLSVDMDAPVE